jgi:hypothetical protein
MPHIPPTLFAIDFGVNQVVCLTTLPAAASRGSADAQLEWRPTLGDPLDPGLKRPRCGPQR